MTYDLDKTSLDLFGFKLDDSQKETLVELDILECEVKWALGSTMNKARGGDRIPVELF